MKIFILDKYKITKFNLPEKIEDSFLIPYKGNDNKNSNVVTVEAVDEKWQLKSNGNVNVVDGSGSIGNVVLNDYKYYSLKVLGQDELATLFSLPDKDVESYKLSLNNLASITIGSSPNCNINYRNSLTADIHAEIKFVNNEWYLAASANDSYRTYINDQRVLTAKLGAGDVIFINGLKIIFMKDFLKINNPGQMVSITGLTIFEELDVVDNTKYTPVTDEEANVELYEESDCFYHMPRIVPVINPEKINIDMPSDTTEQEKIPFLLTMGTSITMVASSGVMIYNIINSLINKKPIAQLIPQMVMAFAMLVGSLIMPRVLKAYQKRKAKQKLKEYREKYKEYLAMKNEKIQYALKSEIQVLRENNLTTKECYNIILNKTRKFWSRALIDEDFLRLRLGTGSVDSFVEVQVPEEHFSVSTNDLQEEAKAIGESSKKIENAPIVIDIPAQSVLPFVFNCTYERDYVNSIMSQILALNSSTDLKIIILTDEKNEKNWEYTKFLPHCWSDDKTLRFFGSNLNEYKTISTYLETEYKNRTLVSNSENEEQDSTSNLKYKSCPPYYLIITDCYDAIKNISILPLILGNSKNYGFSILTISNSIRKLPTQCERFVQIGEKEGCIFEKKISSKSQVVFTTEYEKKLDMDAVAIKLSNVPVLTKDALSELPSSISFLDIYGVGKIEQLNILNRWHVNSPVSTLSTPIGVHSDGELFTLDLHEKFQGPHGLIAGTTGSGKSEFIITYILSMCINYHPYEVQFVLIDYKGGGLAGAFENKETGVKVPHLVGTITNLDTAEMNRSLVSISSELKRRQKKFNEVKDKLEESTMDIYKYQKFYREGLIDEPMAHLFIISDEFAELKSQQPEFLNELVSTARIGRSLGVHLILATQKPSGVVNDQIWSNSKFKVCLKVQNRSDSMEMLKRPEAASIREAGRFYLQVGYDDYFDIGQSGWGGAKYVPTDKIVKKVDDSISFINNIGEPIKTINDMVKKEVTEDLGDQLTNTVKYIYKLSQKENLVTRPMWLDSIPSEIYYNDIKNKYSYKPTPYIIAPAIGEYDNPAAQSQGILNLDLSNNLLIYGKGGSGKENLLTTILWGSIVEHTPSEVNFYIIDCGAETLKMFYKIPHVGEVSVQDENEKVIDTFNMILGEFQDRKDRYVDFAGSFENYNENSGNRDTLIVTIINNYEIFTETFAKLSEQVQSLYRDGKKYGIVFIISCLASNAVRGKMAQNFPNKIALQMPTPDDYRSILNSPKGLVPSSYFGRGLFSFGGAPLEFQTANVCDNKQLNNVIKSAAEQLNQAYTVRAKRVPTIPAIVNLKCFDEMTLTLNEVPLGFNIANKNILKYSFIEDKINCILSENMPGNLPFVWALIKLLKKVSNVNIKIVDFVDICKDRFENTTVFKDNFDNAIITINNEIAKENESDMINYYILIGAGELDSELSDSAKQIFNNLMEVSKSLNKSYFMLIDNYQSFKRMELYEWFGSKINPKRGIWLGDGIANQMIFKISNVDMDLRKMDFPGMAVVIENNNLSIIKSVMDVEELSDEK